MYHLCQSDVILRKKLFNHLQKIHKLVDTYQEITHQKINSKDLTSYNINFNVYPNRFTNKPFSMNLNYEQNQPLIRRINPLYYDYDGDEIIYSMPNNINLDIDKVKYKHIY